MAVWLEVCTDIDEGVKKLRPLLRMINSIAVLMGKAKEIEDTLRAFPLQTTQLETPRNNCRRPMQTECPLMMRTCHSSNVKAQVFLDAPQSGFPHEKATISTSASGASMEPSLPQLRRKGVDVQKKILTIQPAGSRALGQPLSPPMVACALRAPAPGSRIISRPRACVSFPWEPLSIGCLDKLELLCIGLDLDRCLLPGSFHPKIGRRLESS
jgi:hypothetical protein